MEKKLFIGMFSFQLLILFLLSFNIYNISNIDSKITDIEIENKRMNEEVIFLNKKLAFIETNDENQINESFIVEEDKIIEKIYPYFGEVIRVKEDSFIFKTNVGEIISNKEIEVFFTKENIELKSSIQVGIKDVLIIINDSLEKGSSFELVSINLND